MTSVPASSHAPVISIPNSPSVAFAIASPNVMTGDISR